MNRVLRFACAFLVGVLFLGISSIAEEITLTTYYPAPYGVYEELETKGDTYLATDSGNVGIGTTNPTSKLHIQTGDGPANVLTTEPSHSNAVIKLKYTNDTNWQGIGIDGGKCLWIDNRWGGGSLVFRQSGNVVFMLNSVGNAGIGTTNPTAKLDVNGTVKASSYATGSETGATGTFTTADGKIVTVTNGIITDIQ